MKTTVSVLVGFISSNSLSYRVISPRHFKLKIYLSFSTASDGKSIKQEEGTYTLVMIHGLLQPNRHLLHHQ